jgi:hypothetical protein
MPNHPADWRRLLELCRVKSELWLLASVHHPCSLSMLVVIATRTLTQTTAKGEWEPKDWSGDNRSWSPIDRGLSHVTGRINRVTNDALEEVKSGSLNLIQTDSEILSRFERYESTCPVQEGAYQILAVGRLAPPFGVWLSTKTLFTIRGKVHTLTFSGEPHVRHSVP